MVEIVHLLRKLRLSSSCIYSMRALFGIGRYDQNTSFYIQQVFFRNVGLSCFYSDAFFLLHLHCKVHECQRKQNRASLGNQIIKCNRLGSN